MCYCCGFFFFSSRRRHTRCALVTGVQTCALPISCILTLTIIHSSRTTDGFRPIRIVVDGGTLQARIEQLVSVRSEEHTSELQSLMRISYAVFCLKKKKTKDVGKQTQDNSQE